MAIPLTPDLAGQVAILTGASRGIGLAIAQAFLQAGASVCITARKQNDLDAALSTQAPSAEAAGGRAVACADNAGDSEAIRACVAYVMDTFGRVDICVNNAATNPAFGQLMDIDMVRYRKTMAVNVEGPLQFVQACWKARQRARASAWNRSLDADWHGGARIPVISVESVLDSFLGVCA